MLETILTTAITCLASLTVTFIFNLFINGTKKARIQKEQNLEETIRSIVESAISGVNTKIDENHKEQKQDNKLLKTGLQAVLKNDLKVRYEYWINEGWAPLDAKDDLERMYQIYHNLGANGVMDGLREEFLNLPSRTIRDQEN